MSPNEIDLRQSLHEDAERIDTHGDFAGRAIALDRRRARRRVTAVTAAVAAAAVGATVPLLWSGNGRGVSPVPATTSVVTTAPSPSPSTPTQGASTPGTPTPSSPPTTTTGAPVPGASPDAYAVDDRLIIGGTTIQLQKGTIVERFAVLQGGTVVLSSRMPGGDTQNELVGANGRTVKRLPAGTWVVSSDRNRFVFGDSTTATVYDQAGAVVTKRADARWPAAFVGTHVYLKGEQSASLDWDIATGATRNLPADVVAVSPDRTRAATQSAGSADGVEPGCWGVRDLTASGFPTLIERCGATGNPAWFMPTDFSSQGTYLVGSKYVDGGFWFIAAVFRVSDGKDMLGGTDTQPVSGWSWRLADDEQSLVISRNTSTPVAPATRNTLQRCTLAMECTPLAQQLPLLTAIDPRYTVGR